MAQNCSESCHNQKKQQRNIYIQYRFFLPQHYLDKLEDASMMLKRKILK